MSRNSSGKNLVWTGLLILALAPGCQESAPDDLIVEEETTEVLIFVKTKGEETLNRSNAEGNLYKLSPISPDGKVTAITNYTGARISDPTVSYDGTKILFSMRPPGGSARNIYEINVDGTELRQVTSGGGDDFDPLYLPDGCVMFTSNRDGEMDEYNHSPAEHLYRCDMDGENIERVSFNQSDDFDPTVLPSGQIVYTRWEHFGNFNRFPLFVTNPDGTGTFHKYGPHNRNFFHAQPTPDGRLIAIESTRINMDAGPIAVLKLEGGPADPAVGDNHWDVLTTQVNNDGAPWAYGAFKYPFPLEGNKYVASYTLPSATEDEVDYGLYTFTLKETGAGTEEDPARIEIVDLTFLYNDPEWNEYDACIAAPRDKEPVIEYSVDKSVDFGIFMAQDIFNRGTSDGQERPQKGVDVIDKIAVIAARPTMRGEMNNISANEFEKRALLGFAPVQEDGSFRIKVPADMPVSFATLDDLERGFVVKRTWIYTRPGEEFDKCTGCHEDRGTSGEFISNPNPLAKNMEPTDLNIRIEDATVINYENDIGPIVQAKCQGCHLPTITYRDSLVLPDSVLVLVPDTTAPPGSLDLSPDIDTTMMDRVFPRAYISLSGENEMGGGNVVSPAFPRRSKLIDYVMGIGAAADQGQHPVGGELTQDEVDLFKMWVLLGAQYK